MQLLKQITTMLVATDCALAHLLQKLLARVGGVVDL